jgi:quinoprotein glucose dehydrogenase
MRLTTNVQITRLFRATAAWGVLYLTMGAGGGTGPVARNTVSAAGPATPVTTEWPYGGQPAQDHYSTLSQINRRNVKELAVAWSYDTGEAGGMETSPLVANGIVYGVTAKEKVIALGAGDGHLLWKFDPGLDGGQPVRGLSLWTDGKESRLFAGIMNYLYCLDPETGRPIAGFAEDGRVDLRKGLRGEDYESQSIAMTTPGTIYHDLIIVGGREPETSPAPPGDIRAFDVHSGALRWIFHTIPHPGEPGYETWPPDAWKTAGSANNWAGMTLDDQRGILYVPTGSAVPDFYGAGRIGNDLFADTLLALDAATGKLLWHFQGVHHDLWDRDFPSPPALVTVQRNGRAVDAVAQTSKQGWVFLFDRVTGAPLFPIEERSYPASDVPGEVTAPTQPLPSVPAPYARQLLSEDLLTTRTPEAHAWALEQFRTFRSGGQFLPFAVGRQTVVFPGFDGGAEWGGPAVDPAKAVIYVNANDIAWTGGLEPEKHGGGSGVQTYQNTCAVCHGSARAGSPPAFPSLIDIEQRLSAAQITTVIHQGRGRMPAFPGITGSSLDALLDYLRTGKDTGSTPESGKELANAAADDPNLRYRFTGYQKFYDPDGYPAVAPPWGTLNAIDLNTGQYLWKIPLGEYPELATRGVPTTGSENYGGPILTAGGLVFIGATIFDRRMHAFDSSNGRLLWEATLPYAGLATPATYMFHGRQYVVIAAGGGRNPKETKGGAYVAFALP